MSMKWYWQGYREKMAAEGRLVDAGEGIEYVLTQVGDKFKLEIWVGKRAVIPTKEAWTNLKENALKIVESWVANAKLSQKYKAERKEKRKEEQKKTLGKFKVGAVLHYSWGYEQTNCEFWQVVEMKGQTVKLKRIASETVRDTGPYSSQVKPVPDSFLDENRYPAVTKRIGAGGVSFEHGGGYLVEDPATASYHSSWGY